MNKLEEGDYITIDDLVADLFGEGFGSNLATTSLSALFLVSVVKEIGQALFAGIFTELNFLAIRKAQPARVSFLEAFQLHVRTDVPRTDFWDTARDLGYEPEIIDRLFEISHRLPDVGELLEFRRRKEIDDDQLETALGQLGFKKQWSDKIKVLVNYIAPPQDVFRFMARDMFEPDVVAGGRLLEGSENPDWLRLTELAGVSRELADLYYGSHWILPSINQGFEMLHREKIEPERIDELFKAADVAPGWRQPLLDIAFNLPTRVDVRRAFEDGVIDDDKLKEFIRHSGVAPDWQEIIFDWHVQRRARRQEGRDTTKTLTQSQILNAFEDGVIILEIAIERLMAQELSREDAIILLASRTVQTSENDDARYFSIFQNDSRKIALEGYRTRTLSREVSFNLLRDSLLSSELSNRILDLTDRQYDLDRKAEIIKATRKLFIGYEVSENKLFTLMLAQGFTKEEIDDHTKDLIPLRELRFRELTRADIRKGVIDALLGIDWGVEQLKGLGYSDITITKIMQIEQWPQTVSSDNTNGVIELSS